MKHEYLNKLKKKLNEQVFLSPIMAALVVVLNAINIVQPNFEWLEVAIAIGIVLAVTALILTACYYLFSRATSAAFAAAVTVFALAYFNLVEALILKWLLNSPFQIMARFVIILILMIGLYVVLIYWFNKTLSKRENIGFYLNIILLALVFFSIVNISKTSITGALNSQCCARLNSEKHTHAAQHKPDVYWIILDAYTSNESLQKYWGYDNYDFTSRLQKMGFHVIPDSRSESAATQVSISSTLNMGICAATVKNKETEYYKNWCFSRIRKSHVGSLFKEMGYDIINLSLFRIEDTKMFYKYSGYGFNLGDRVIHNSIIGFVLQYLEGRMKNATTPWSVNDDIIEKLKGLFEGDHSRPVFVYAHIMSPHPPYVYSSEGLINKNISSFPDKKQYLEQLKFTNQQILKLLENTKRRMDKATIIIIQGDHGSRVLALEQQGKNENLSIFNAMYIPGSEPSWFWSGMRSVDTFRLIFNKYFGGNYPYLSKPDDSNGGNDAKAVVGKYINQ